MAFVVFKEDKIIRTVDSTIKHTLFGFPSSDKGRAERDYRATDR